MLQQVNQTEARDLEWSCELFRPWMSAATLPQPSTVVSAGVGSAPSMLKMRPTTPAFSSRGTKGAKPSWLRRLAK